jgi:hypothetical protein
MFLKSPPWCHILNIRRGRAAPPKSREPTVLASPTACRPLPRWGCKASSWAGEQGGSFLLSLAVFLTSSNTCVWINVDWKKGGRRGNGSAEYLDDEMTGEPPFCSPPSGCPQEDMRRARSGEMNPIGRDRS